MIEIIPAIDIIEGKCVRLTQGDYGTRKVYNENPLEAAKAFEDCGLKRLHVVDLDGAREGKIMNYRTLEKLVSGTSLTIDFGGGLKSDKDLEIAFESGAEMVTGGSIAVKSPELFCKWIELYGSERIILGADAKNEKIAVGGWQETTEKDLIPFIEHYQEKGIQKVICTDIDKDGMLQGASVELYKKIHETFPGLYLIASGGIGALGDIQKLETIGVPAVILGKAIYEGRIRLEELEQFNTRN